jgi:multidrug efflux pump subunit AcrA (membrane-fusion protein)
MKLALNKRWLYFVAVSAVAVAVVAGYTLWSSRAKIEGFMTAKVERGDIRNTVSATGTLQAVTTVQVGSQVSGTIQALYADFNSEVKKGQVIAQLDPAIFQAQVKQARANLKQARADGADANAKLSAAKATVENLRAGVSSASANVAALKAQLDDAMSLLKRQEELAERGIISQREPGARPPRRDITRHRPNSTRLGSANSHRQARGLSRRRRRWNWRRRELNRPQPRWNYPRSI